MVESVDTLDLKSSGQQCPCGFKSHLEYSISPNYWGFFISIMGAFVISTKLNGQYKFEFTSRKGKVILTSGGYESKEACEAGITRLQENLETARFETSKAAGGKFLFRIVLGEELLSTSRKFTTELLLQKAIDELRKTALVAETLDFSGNALIFPG